ncbi:hypothetical protein ACFSO9_15235 [Mesonia maritima]|uniref:hypothetical protein n=1 Tax=Mesonia maritima TaxID=1793873 RepID=UPI0036330597
MFNNPPNHDFASQPSLTIKLFDETGALVQSRCIVSDPEDCIFTQVPGTTGYNTTLVSDWSCVKLNTIELQGQASKVEITVTDCDQGGHWGVGYFDNLYIGDDGPNVCSDSAFGYMAVNPIDQPSGDYETCSLFSEPVDPNCAPALAANNVTFPIEICGTYSAPTGNPNGGDAPVTDITIDVVSNGTVVYSASTFTQPSPGEFCITINQSDISNPYGEFTIEGELEFTMNCGTPYNYYVQAQSNGFKFCPVAGCPTPFPPECNAGGNPNPISYDLTSRDSDILSNIPASEQGNYEITYYDDETGALTQDPNSLIANPATYSITTTTVVYYRLDYDYGALGIAPVDDCYDVVPLEIVIGEEPNTPATVVDLETCGNGGTGEFNLEDRLSDIFLD